jgi:hypothetical protein
VSLWNLILIASIAVLALKLAGYLVPPSLLEKPTPSRIAGLLTVALLAALVAVNTLTTSRDIVLDARLPALVLAGVLFALRVPFIVVLIVAAVTAALLRLWAGMP